MQPKAKAKIQPKRKAQPKATGVVAVHAKTVDELKVEMSSLTALYMCEFLFYNCLNI